MSDITRDMDREIRDSYLVQLVKGTVNLARKAVAWGCYGMEYLTSPTARMINTRPDHDDRHKSLHYTYHRSIKSG